MKNSMLLGLNDLDIIIKKLQEYLKEDCIVLLRGDLASGKTTLVKHFVKSAGISDLVTSPTFSLQSIYGNTIFHYDVYNKSLEEFVALGLLEEFEKSGLHFVEWGDEKLEKILRDYGFKTINLEIVKCENKRVYTINA